VPLTVAACILGSLRHCDSSLNSRLGMDVCLRHFLGSFFGRWVGMGRSPMQSSIPSIWKIYSFGSNFGSAQAMSWRRRRRCALCLLLSPPPPHPKSTAQVNTNLSARCGNPYIRDVPEYVCLIHILCPPDKAQTSEMHCGVKNRMVWRLYYFVYAWFSYPWTVKSKFIMYWGFINFPKSLQTSIGLPQFNIHNKFAVSFNCCSEIVGNLVFRISHASEIKILRNLLGYFITDVSVNNLPYKLS
jgi:hypothetical protein